MFKAVSTPLPDLKDWRFSVDQWGIGWAVFDREGESQNSLGRRPLEELGAIVAGGGEGRARQAPSAGSSSSSGKEKGFIVGADIREFEDIKTEMDVIDRLRPVNALFDRIERLPVPVVCCHPRLLPRRRARAGARLPLPHRHPRRRHQARLPRGQARHLPRLQRHGALDPAGRRARRHAGDADGQRCCRPPPRAAWASSTSSSSRGALLWAARKAVLRKRKSKPAGFAKAILSMWPARGLLATRMRQKTTRRCARITIPRPSA